MPLTWTTVTTCHRAETTTAVLATLDEKITAIAAETAAAKQNQQEHEKVLQANLKEVYDKQKDKSLGGMMGRRGPHIGGYSDKESMHMDVDEPPENSKGKNRK